jgi:hypothetical protein
VVVTVPDPEVVPVVELSVPQAAVGLPTLLKETGSPLTAPPLESVTVAVNVEVEGTVAAPSAGRLFLLAVRVIDEAVAVLCVIVAEPLAPTPLPADEAVSVAVTVQNPAVVDDL